VNRQRTNVTAGKKQGAHDIGIRGHGHPSGGERKLRGIVPGFQEGIAERLAEHLVQQLMH